jgi:pyrroloquinoline quinone biosynthesis protein E
MSPHAHVVLEVTEACPHACLHCYNHWRDHRARTVTARTLDRAEIRAVIRAIRADAPLRNVGISGGEPLLRSDLPGIVSDLMDDDLNVVVVTSGALLSTTRVRRFPPGTLFDVTLFSADANLHDRIAGRRGAFRRVLEGATRALTHDCSLGVTVVVSSLNAHDVRRTLELGIALGAEAFLLNRVNASRLTWSQTPWLLPTAAQLKEALDAAEAVAATYGATISVSVPVPPCVVDPGGYRHLHFGWCPRGGSNAYYTISHDGMLRPCNHSSLVLGDLRKQSFAELVESRAAVEFWAPVPAPCRTCAHPLRDLCRGGCTAASSECFGTQARPDPLVDIALQPQAAMPAAQALL